MPHGAGSGPRRRDVRPTAARVRDALFNTLGTRVNGARVLDLFAGSGGLGIEALRRGAASAVFVEREARMAQTIKRRLLRGGLAERGEVQRRDVRDAVRGLGIAGRRFEVILLDPPYGEAWILQTLSAIVRSRILAPGGVVVAEGHWRDRPDLADLLICRREARYGETVLWYFERGEGGSVQ